VETETDFRKALELEPARRQGRSIPRHSYWPRTLLYSDHVRYVEQLKRYHAVFPSEQMLVLIYDDFRRDNEAAVRQVLDFLDVDDEHPIDVLEANPTVAVRSRQLHGLVHAVSVGRGPVSLAVKGTIKSLTRRRWRHDLLRVTKQRVVYGEVPAPDEDLMLELRRRFEPEVLALSDYLGRDLVKLWGYDSLA
jgi:hypothetical protein